MSWHLPLLRDPSLQPLLMLRQERLEARVEIQHPQQAGHLGRLVEGRASPDAPALESYWAERRRKGPSAGRRHDRARLLQAQHGRCPVCGGLLLHADHPPRSLQAWETRRAVIRKAISKQYVAFLRGSTPGDQRIRLLHTQCQRRNGATELTGPAPSPGRELTGLA